VTKALTYKELRETLGVVVAGLAALLLVALANIGWSPLPLQMMSSGQAAIPFVGDSFVFQFGVAAFGLAVGLGLRQSIGDFTGDAQLFLLHRPISRRRIYVTKLLVGLALYLVCGVVPIALYAWWAALPGTHASPFDWSMTADAWITWLAMTAAYLGAFLSGIRPAAWFGTRLAPLVAAFFPLMFLGALAVLVVSFPWTIGLLMLIAVNAALTASILYVASTRDFA
jgi:hypothetical protein